MGTAIVITSGKGGTGKTSLTGGVASCLAAMGRRVLCIDADVGLRNLDLTLGMTDRVLMDFTDVLDGRCSLSEGAAEHERIKGLFLLTAPVSVAPEEIDATAMAALVVQAKANYDYVLLDAPAGVGPGFRLVAGAADRAVVVATGDSSSLRDAQRTAMLLDGYHIPQHLVMNRVRAKLFQRLHTTVDDAMDATGLPLLGLVPEDEQVSMAANRGVPLITVAKRGAPMAYYRIAKRLDGQTVPLMRIR